MAFSFMCAHFCSVRCAKCKAEARQGTIGGIFKQNFPVQSLCGDAKGHQFLQLLFRSVTKFARNDAKELELDLLTAALYKFYHSNM